jgi:Tetracyclin repressor-like, C-terminal domain
VVGLCTARYLLAVEPLASMDAAGVIEVSGDAIQRLLTMQLPPVRR